MRDWRTLLSLLPAPWVRSHVTGTRCTRRCAVKRRSTRRLRPSATALRARRVARSTLGSGADGQRVRARPRGRALLGSARAVRLRGFDSVAVSDDVAARDLGWVGDCRVELLVADPG